jgi:hypothetical protein
LFSFFVRDTARIVFSVLGKTGSQVDRMKPEEAPLSQSGLTASKTNCCAIERSQGKFHGGIVSYMSSNLSACWRLTTEAWFLFAALMRVRLE